MCVGIVPDGVAGIFKHNSASNGRRLGPKGPKALKSLENQRQKERGTVFSTDFRGQKELVAMKDRKGIARLALRSGTPVLPAYSFGNTAAPRFARGLEAFVRVKAFIRAVHGAFEAFSCWYDSFGILESFSRKAQASIFFFWGRFGLPIPRRTQVDRLKSQKKAQLAP